jgi:1-acyl-sn-glycerol-3-phosphate acyltransferase
VKGAAVAAPSPGVGSLRAAWRLARSGLHALHGSLICIFVFPFLDDAARRRHVGWWSARMLVLLGIELRISGPRPRAPVLLLANHVSWLDILAINAVQPVRFVSKADVRAWPVLGFMVASGGTLFIERERKRDALRVVHQVAEALRVGATVAVFPEGTTGDGPLLLPFHANLLQAAIATATPVQPLALRYADAMSAFSPAVVWLGETSLAGSAWKIVSAASLQARVELLPPHETAGAGRRQLAAAMRARIQAALDKRE